MPASLIALSAALAAAEPASMPVLPEGLILDVRLRYELVDQDGFAREADALTLRTRLGFETPRRNGLSVLIEAENTAHLAGDFADTVDPAPGFPVIADPEMTELNRLQISYENAQKAGLTLGRQYLVLDDQRFVGPVGFRQNSQTFDAIDLTSGAALPVRLRYAYIDTVHRLFGDDHPLGEFDSNSHLAEAAVDTPLGEAALFALVLDFENAPGLSSQTWGARLAGAREALSWRVEYARQSEHAGNPAKFDVDHVRAEADYAFEAVRLGAGVQILGGDGANASQTPLATLHKYQGAADAFLTRPAEGLRDLYLHASVTLPGALPRPLTLRAAVHDFASDDGDLDFGSELDLSAGLALTDRIDLEAKAALFDGGPSGPADRTKLWLTLTYTY